MINREVYILILTASIFVSISLFEILLVFGLLFSFYELLKEKKVQKGTLLKPIYVFSGVSVLSTAFFNPKYMLKGIEDGLFQLIYLFKIDRESVIDLGKRISFLFILFGILLYPVAIFRFLKEGQACVIWGSTFEAGHFYSFFSLTALLLSIYAKDKKFSSIFFLLFILFSLIIVFSFRRTAFLEFFLGTILVSFLLLKNKYAGKKFLVFVSIYLLFFSFFDYWFLSKRDIRFQYMNKVLSEKKVTEKDIVRISSSRYYIMLDALEIIKNDIKNKNISNLLFGHGVRSGTYLPHKYSTKIRERYESFFIISEFIERGLIGVIAILMIMFYSFKTFLTLKVKKMEDIYVLVLFIPLILHLIGVTFTFFWDALLPAYLLLFKAGEVYFGKSGAV